MRKSRQRRLLTCAISLLVCFLAITFTSPAQAQLSFLGNGNSANTGLIRPAGVDRYGSLEVTWVASPLTGN